MPSQAVGLQLLYQTNNWMGDDLHGGAVGVAAVAAAVVAAAASIVMAVTLQIGWHTVRFLV